MKIGIITCFNMNNVNYGNRLQAYALNEYLHISFPQHHVETIYYTFKDFSRNKKEPLFSRVDRKVRRDFLKEGVLIPEVQSRLEAFNSFSERYIKLCNHAYTKKDFQESDFDMLIVGSDVVWLQDSFGFKNYRFLDFEAKKPFIKIAYSASFGHDFIPECNIPDVKRALSSFDFISVRERSSVKLLNNIGIENVKHCIDPTLLVEPEQWISLEKKPKVNINEGEFIFAYILGSDEGGRRKIKNFSTKLGIPIVNVPYANGKKNKFDQGFGDITIMDCSIEEWLWCIRHSKYNITDSFHAVAFSVIFQQPFIVVQRKDGAKHQDLNNRMADFLNIIGEDDKLIDLSCTDSLEQYKWSYDSINVKVDSCKRESKSFIEQFIHFGEISVK